MASEDYIKEDYDTNRGLDHPSLTEQLDMLFHDMTAGKGDKNGEWYKAIAAVKTKWPKDNSGPVE